jgi:hypothetical protein
LVRRDAAARVLSNAAVAFAAPTVTVVNASPDVPPELAAVIVVPLVPPSNELP